MMGFINKSVLGALKKWVEYLSTDGLRVNWRGVLGVMKIINKDIT